MVLFSGSDWLRGWRDLCGPIVKRGKTKLKQSWWCAQKGREHPILWCAFTLFLLETHRSARSVRRGKSFSKSYRLHTRGWAKLSKSYYRNYLLYLILRSIVLFLVNTRYPSHSIFSMRSNEKHSNVRSMFTFPQKNSTRTLIVYTTSNRKRMMFFLRLSLHIMLGG